MYNIQKLLRFQIITLNGFNLICSGSADAIITLVNGGANVESHDKDGLTGNCLQIGTENRRLENWGVKYC